MEEKIKAALKKHTDGQGKIYEVLFIKELMKIFGPQEETVKIALDNMKDAPLVFVPDVDPIEFARYLETQYGNITGLDMNVILEEFKEWKSKDVQKPFVNG